ncbi:SDR family oxidoreductase [Gordonia hydrophobica]|uniref:SDR family oxidoreductase n=1 Tax=Gordonia hydrophobica TaxID=40516 RepID=A0ABZ2U1V5_9ACTN|nr:SDR family oxidoreductase [Gordonia hydrophobica]MBM7366741.1 NAD(P)-dependent dehydrogenase (short-subunit alcohol dehydrogenase family) [Gordonia hydrophobica]
MTCYFVTGGSGFIGRRVVERLLARDDSSRVHVLVRPGTLPRFASLMEQVSGHDRIITVVGDITQDGLGLRGSELGPIDHVIHLAALHDVSADDAEQREVNVEGTRRVAEFAVDHGAMLHHLSSLAVAGDHDGDFTENDFDLGQGFPTGCHRTKFDAERVVRETAGLRWRIYRPGAVVGDSVTGATSKADGPYLFFGHLTQLGQLPSFLPLPMPDFGRLNLVPVDFAAEAIVALAESQPGRSGLVFHLADPDACTSIDLFNAISPAFDGPRGFPAVPSTLVRPALVLSGRSPFRSGRDLVAEQAGIPPAALDAAATPVIVRSTDTIAQLDALGIRLPQLDDYAPRLWRYWFEHLDPARHRRDDPRGPLVGKHILITGASSGIGRATARMCVRRGATVFLVARDADRLVETAAELEAEVPKPGLPLGRAYAYPADISDESAVQTLVKSVLSEHDHVDILVNNAGRSIRRATANAVDRSHDYHRTMAVNYFGAVYLTLALLPHMTARQSGHIVNVSSIEVLSRAPRFGAYAASKAALEAFSDATSAETLSDHVTFSNVRIPLTRTRMIVPTNAYDTVRGIWSVDKASTRVLHAMIERPQRVTTLLGDLIDFGHHAAPRLTNRLLHQDFLMHAESDAALGRGD